MNSNFRSDLLHLTNISRRGISWPKTRNSKLLVESQTLRSSSLSRSLLVPKPCGGEGTLTKILDKMGKRKFAYFALMPPLLLKVSIQGKTFDQASFTIKHAFQMSRFTRLRFILPKKKWQNEYKILTTPISFLEKTAHQDKKVYSTCFFALNAFSPLSMTVLGKPRFLCKLYDNFAPHVFVFFFMLHEFDLFGLVELACFLPLLMSANIIKKRRRWA